MALPWPLGITRFVPQEKKNGVLFFRTINHRPSVRSRWLDVGFVLILHVYGPRLVLALKQSKERD